ncbi:MAG TPA: hypothetical protein VG708_08265, partial [Mycobacteriales bacterium]|nr:hypothetical protein [Mycobacteriales bacterium]
MTELRRLPWRLRYQYAARWASARRRLAARLTHLHADVTIARSAYLGPGFGLAVPGPATLRIGERNEFRRDFFCEIAAGGVVEFADDVIFTSSALIQISTSLTIGRRAVGLVAAAAGGARDASACRRDHPAQRLPRSGVRPGDPGSGDTAD